MDRVSTSPIFIFSAGWRSGSTLLQRYLTATGGVLMWGEDGGAISHLRLAVDNWEQMLGPGNRRFHGGWGAEGELLLEEFKAALTAGNPGEVWAATMNPPASRLAACARDFLLEYYGKEALALNISRWGAKYVMADESCAAFIKKLFPDARILFLVRDPLKAIQSIKRHDWIHRKPSFETLRFFTCHWQRLAQGFMQSKLGLLVRYEDFINDPAAQRRILDYVELPDPPMDFIRNSRVDWKAMDDASLSRFERSYVKWRLRKERAALGYG